MALRDNIAKGAQPHLEQGEQIRHVFVAQTGPSPYWAFLTYFIWFAVQVYDVVVTDRNVVFFRASFWRQSNPKYIEGRFPRNMRFGPMTGLWGKMEIDGRKFWVHKRFHKDVAAADAEVSGAQAPAPQTAQI
jgi:hypothetical protein